MTGGQDVQSLIGCSKAQDWFIWVQAGHLLLGNLPNLTALLPVEKDGFHRRRLAVDEWAAETLAQRSVGEVWSAGRKLFVPFGGLDVACEHKESHQSHDNAFTATQFPYSSLGVGAFSQWSLHGSNEWFMQAVRFNPVVLKKKPLDLSPGKKMAPAVYKNTGDFH